MKKIIFLITIFLFSIKMFGQITNNTIAWNGTDAFIGSTPSGGNGTYTYVWQAWLIDPASDSQPDPQIIPGASSINYQFNQTVPQESQIDGIYFRRIVSSGNQTSYSNWAAYDLDGDGFDNLEDNCPSISNPNQTDSDNDGIGDLCDNCPNISNPNQQDSDGDNIGNVCDSDKDGDGVPNSEDPCPNEFGNSSNFGCPGNPDLVIDEDYSLQYSSCYSCNGYFSDVSSSNRPSIYRYGGNITFYPLVIKNIGDGDCISGSLKVRFYLSDDMNLSTDDLGFGNRTIQFYPLNSGESTPINGTSSGSLDVSIEGSDIGDQVPYGNYYLIILIDGDNELGNSEQNTDNNTYYLPINYTGTLPNGRAYLNNGGNLIEVPLSVDSPVLSKTVKAQKSFNLKIYDMSLPSLPVMNLSVIKEQIVDISSLSKGTYIVHVNDNYVKKFKL